MIDPWILREQTLRRAGWKKDPAFYMKPATWTNIEEVLLHETVRRIKKDICPVLRTYTILQKMVDYEAWRVWEEDSNIFIEYVPALNTTRNI